MNIYIHTEISLRELDGNLLLGTLAATKGHDVIISDISGIFSALKKGILPPGIFHTKSLSPNEGKIKRHQEFLNNSFLITSIDQEASLNEESYNVYLKNRFSDQTIAQSSAIFGWGVDEVRSLKKKYPNHESKIFMTGSPRADLWKPIFSDYWVPSKKIPTKPYLLISSNMGVCHYKYFHDQIKCKRDLGIYQRDPGRLQLDFIKRADGFRVTAAFIEAIQYLSEKNDSFDIVLRPHPTESVEYWKILLGEIPNLHIIKDGSITGWVNKAFAIMHNGCTSAIEATISNKPLITYYPFEYPITVGKLANKLGYKVNTLQKLHDTVNLILNNDHFSQQITTDDESFEIIKKKIYLDKKELASEKILTIWEKLNRNKFSQKPDWEKLKWFLRLRDFRDKIGLNLKKLFPNKFEHFREDNKFLSSFNLKDIESRINRIKSILEINENVNCEILSKRTILIRRK